MKEEHAFGSDVPADARAEAFVGLGSNLGDRLARLQEAVRGLAASSGVRVAAVSPVYETEAHTPAGAAEQPAYLNAVAALATGLSPEELLRLCLALEAAAGRDRSAGRRRWAPRPLDLDLLVYGRETRRTVRLTLPHPRLGERRFVLRPLVDLCPNLYVPPPFEATAAALLAQCPDSRRVARIPHTLVAP